MEHGCTRDTWTVATPFPFRYFRNVVAKKRDASTDLLRRPHAHTLQHSVDFDMSAFSAVGNVFADPEFSAPGNSLF